MSNTTSILSSSGPFNSLSKFSSDNLFHSCDFIIFMWLNTFCDSKNHPPPPPPPSKRILHESCLSIAELRLQPKLIKTKYCEAL